MVLATYCGCGNVPVRYFIETKNSTFYWCGVCIDLETMDMVLRCLGLDKELEIGEYDGPPISCADGSPMPQDTESGLCKHWKTDLFAHNIQSCHCDGTNGFRECKGELAKCINPKYRVGEDKSQYPYTNACDSCGHYNSKNPDFLCRYCGKQVKSWKRS